MLTRPERRDDMAKRRRNRRRQWKRKKKKKKRWHKYARNKPWLPDDIVVWSYRVTRCSACPAEFIHDRTLVCFEGGRRKPKNAVCLACAGLDGYVFVPAGDHKLTRRASKYSAARGVIVGRPIKYINRYGILVQPEALHRALDECEMALPDEAREPIGDTGVVLAEDVEREYKARHTSE